MPVYETFSKRQKRLAQAGQADVYQYDDLPQPFRVQIGRILTRTLGSCAWHVYNPEEHFANVAWNTMFETLAQERGLDKLGSPHPDPDAQCKHFLMKGTTEEVLDLIELGFRLINHSARALDEMDITTNNINQTPDDAIEELNHRFKEHNIGYQFEGSQLIRVDSQYLHAEAVKPAITLLQDAAFQGPAEEFLEAHKYYRQGDYKNAIVLALKAFESTMKAICDARQWVYPSTATAKELITLVLQEELIPAYLLNQFHGLRMVLEAGLPTVRNKTSGHGQGATPVIIPDYLAAYALHLAASNIVLLVEAHKVKL